MTPGFTPEQRRVIANYVRWVADHMDLRDWTFEMMFDPPPNAGTMAMIRPVYGRRIAAIWFMRDFANLDPEKLRHALVHELAHVITDGITSVLENIGPKLLGDATFAVLWETTKEQSELATDHVADLVASHMPLIDWTMDGDPQAPGVSWVAEPSPQLGPGD